MINETITTTQNADGMTDDALTLSSTTETLSVTQLEPQNLSIKPSIQEAERFISFLNDHFQTKIDLSDLLILIHETKPTLKGYFRSVGCNDVWVMNNTTFKQEVPEVPLNSIVLSSHTLGSTPYETLAHEFAHYVNYKNGIKDCSTNQYHNKHFKAQAEKFLLEVEHDKRRGFAYTKETPEFKAMLEDDFKPEPDAFKIFQLVSQKKKKAGSRLILFMCSCGCKIRTARNQDKPLNASCGYCTTKFDEVDA